MEGLKFVIILEVEYREYLRKQILSAKRGKSRKLTNKDKELIDQECRLHSFVPTVQKVGPDVGQEQAAARSERPTPVPSPAPQTSAEDRGTTQETQLPNTSPAPEELPQ
jgi:hypothetical protein